MITSPVDAQRTSVGSCCVLEDTLNIFEQNGEQFPLNNEISRSHNDVTSVNTK
jgi:hypothetical protein